MTIIRLAPTLALATALACANGGTPPSADDPGGQEGAQAPGTPTGTPGTPTGTPDTAQAGGPPSPITATVDFEVVASLADAGIRERSRVVIRAQDEWTEFWGRLYGNRLPPPAAPDVDFDQQMVIAATMGERPTGGHAIAIESVTVDGGTIRATVVETSPGPTCITTQALTAPAVAVSIETSEGDVEFVEQTATLDC